MAVKEQLEKLAGELNLPAVTLSFNTHRTHPDTTSDEIVLKNLLREAEEKIIAEFGKRAVAPLLQHLSDIPSRVDVNYLLDSLHIFVSNETSEIIKLPWPIEENSLHISDKFSVRPLIKAYSRTEEYHLLLLSQSGAKLYEAINDSITSEVENEDFPFPENMHYIDSREKASDPKQVDNMVREYLNKIDKALVRVCRQTQLRCVVICTEDNYSRLLQVADSPAIYHGYLPINYHQTQPHHLARQSWEFIQEIQHRRRKEAIREMEEAVSEGKVLTDLQEIYRAAVEGRGDLLIVHREYRQPVRIHSDHRIEYVSDSTAAGSLITNDITSHIAWEVLSKKGRVIFTAQEQIKDLGELTLKTRY